MTAVDRVDEQAIKDFISTLGLAERYGDVMRTVILPQCVEVTMLRRGPNGGLVIAGDDVAREIVQIGVRHLPRRGAGDVTK